MNDLDPTGDSAGPYPTQRRLSQPNIAQASAEFLLMESRVSSGPISVLVFLAGIVVLAGFVLAPRFGGPIFLGGLAALVIGVALTRRALGCLGIMLFWPGAGAAVAGAMSLLGIDAVAAYWAVAGLFFLGGFLGARYATKLVPARFLGARAEAVRAGCRIGLFRPFNSANSREAKNVLLPLLRGYGSVYVVSDDSLDQATFDGTWSRDIQQLPQYADDYRYADADWAAAGAGRDSGPRGGRRRCLRHKRQSGLGDPTMSRTTALPQNHLRREHLRALSS
jgi:hypothetical protein